MSFRIINGKPYAVGTNFPKEDINKKNEKPLISEKSQSFNNILTERLNKDKLKVSAHAMERMEALDINKNDLEKVNEAVIKAKDKGCENSVILYKDVAFIASVKNNTLITAVDKERAKENIFTNIDSVIIL